MITEVYININTLSYFIGLSTVTEKHQKACSDNGEMKDDNLYCTVLYNNNIENTFTGMMHRRWRTKPNLYFNTANRCRATSSRQPTYSKITVMKAHFDNLHVLTVGLLLSYIQS